MSAKLVTAQMNAKTPIDALRECIDEVDVQIAEKLQTRAMFALAIARVKGAAGIPARDDERESHILARVQTLTAPGSAFTKDNVRKVYEAILEESRSMVAADIAKRSAANAAVAAQPKDIGAV